MSSVTYVGYLEKLAPHLCDMYTRTRFVPKQHMWPPNQLKLFKNLTFLRHDSQFRQKRLSHIAARYRQTNKPYFTKELKFDVKNAPMFKELEKVHLSICKSNATKNIADLFSYETKFKPRSILVEGAPGVGKTELIKQIAYLWAKSELICDMKLVFVLYLRDPKIHSLKSIGSFIHQYVNSENRYLSTKQAEGVIEELRDSRGSSIAFLIDGFDEFPSRVYENSFIAGLISGEVLPNALLLITSRPSASLVLHSQVGIIFDIVGFAQEEKDQYILESLKDSPKKQNELQQYLKQYPIINSYCYIPLHLTIVIFLLKHASLPQTLTRVNELFILYTIRRSLQQQSKQYKKLRFNELVDLPSEVFGMVLCLSKLAYDGVQGSKLVFSLEEIKQVYPESDTLYSTNGFGLLQAVEHYNPLAGAEITASFNFLHYSMQEYLAAFHISTLAAKEQYSIMVSAKPLHYALSPAQCQSTNLSSFWHNHFIFMWLMYVGITGGQSYAFTLFLCNSGFFVSTGKAYNKIRNSLNIVQILHVFQCFIEASNVEVCNILLEQLFRDGNIKIKGTTLTNMPLFSHHMLSLVNFLAKSPKSYKSLQFANCFFLDGAMNTLEEYFLTYPKKGSSIKYVHFENSCFVSKSEILGIIIKGGHVSEISIINLSNYDIKNIIESLNYNQNLVAVKILEMNLTDSSTELLMQHLSRTKLRALSIANNLCTSSGTRSVANFVSNISTLQFLSISDNIIGLSDEFSQLLHKNIFPINFLTYSDIAGVAALASALEKNPPLLSLNLSSNCIMFILELAYAIYHNKILMSLDLSNNFLSFDDQSSFNVLGIALRINETLKSLNISQNDISDTKMHGMVNALYYNKTLQSLDISGNELSHDLTKNLAHALMYNSFLSLLALGSNSIGDEGAMHLASALELNKTLTSLYLRDNMITNIGAIALAHALKKNTTLTKLDLSMNDISDKGVSAMCDTFCVQNALKVLFICYNPITHAKIEELFIKLASEDTAYYFGSHVPMTNHVPMHFVTQLQNADKFDGPRDIVYRQNASAVVNCNILIPSVLTSDRRSIIFTYDTCHYGWKKCLHHNICLQDMYVRASINYPNNGLQVECLQFYSQKVFNPSHA